MCTLYDCATFICSLIIQENHDGYRYKSRRNYDKNNLKHKQDFENLFFIRSVNLWNSLPADLKSYVPISIFRSGPVGPHR